MNLNCSKPERCHNCGTLTVPQIFNITKENQMVTEGHYVCSNPRCRTRFRITEISRENIQQEN